MALSTKLAAVVVCCALAAAPTATAYYGGGAQLPREECPTQINYFANCLARDEIDRAACCKVVADTKCLCQLKREVAVPCHPHRRHGPCPKSGRPGVKLSELQQLPCFKGLKCY